MRASEENPQPQPAGYPSREAMLEAMRYEGYSMVVLDDRGPVVFSKKGELEFKDAGLRMFREADEMLRHETREGAGPVG